MKRKWLWLAAVAGFMFPLAGAQPVRADHRDDRRECSRKIEKEEHKLEREIRKHGWRSRQAQRQREKLYRIRQQCGYGYGWGRNDGQRGRDDDRWGRDRDHRNHTADGCRDRNHRHDRDGGRFRWSGTIWLRIR